MNDVGRKDSLFKRVVFLVLGVISFGWMLGNLNLVSQALAFLWGLALPLTMGCILAFLLNLPMRFIEEKLFRKRGGRLRRPASLIVSVVIVLLVVLLVLLLILPQVINAAIDLIPRLPAYIDQLETAISPFLESYMPSVKQWLDENDNLLAGMVNEAVQYLQGLDGQTLFSTVSAATSAVGQVISFLIACAFSCYMLILNGITHQMGQPNY